MNGIVVTHRIWLWILPAALLAAVIGWETDWGRALRRIPLFSSSTSTQPVAIALFPEYKIDGGLESRRETVERTLFNPTRRPAPPQQAAAAQPSFPRGQFVLVGTTVIENKATALLREVNGGRSRHVQQGDSINGVTVAEVHVDKVKLSRGSEFEELTLKVATGPKTTVQPPVAAAPSQVQPGPSRPAAAVTAAQPTQPTEASETIVSRRRAARAAQEQAQAAAAAAQAAQVPQAPAATPPQPAANTQAQPAQDNPAWNALYQRYLHRSK